ncbi:hypothetical protein H257_13062 [Aphanomyces astaci]|uniref:Uncharacterized protein n=1 Tax=Aphanomyces astaci TaxID=112090 RepID=W4FVR0_APHAT|nr:hypothetical protein H257_13062 [Aphanomyces astaci]ETV71600.1 hypothetical protein H257_13062 [Aphanomyces astaci]|eukprot:XP_009838788.1 hypothetical protein H257_13062 [Aphanomyces astaci]
MGVQNSSISFATAPTQSPRSFRLLRSRWDFLGHILQYPVNPIGYVQGGPSGVQVHAPSFPLLSIGLDAPSRRCLAPSTLTSIPSSAPAPHVRHRPAGPSLHHRTAADKIRWIDLVRGFLTD